MNLLSSYSDWYDTSYSDEAIKKYNEIVPDDVVLSPMEYCSSICTIEAMPEKMFGCKCKPVFSREKNRVVIRIEEDGNDKTEN